MNIKKNIFLCALMATAFTACSDDNNGSGNGEAITFSAKAEDYNEATRLANTGVNSQWSVNDRIGVYMMSPYKDVPLNGTVNFPFITSSTGQTASFIHEADAIYFPEDFPRVAVIAYYPYTSSVESAVYGVDFTDQSEGIAPHDLMWMKNDEIYAADGTTVPLTLSHQLSRLVVYFVDEDGKAIAPQSVVAKDFIATASFNLYTGAFSNTVVADITPYYNGAAYEMVAMPKSLSESNIIQVDYADELIDWVVSDNDTGISVLAEGYTYVFQVTITPSGPEAVLISMEEASMIPWQSQSSEGEADGETISYDVVFPDYENDNLVRAFPGAEGGGMFTTGGRGGTVIKVTNLNDSGEGSLRKAIETKGARTIVFEVDGVIELKEALKIGNGDVTIAGQTAPGDGICLKNYSLVINADNVIIRYIRSRMGDEAKAEDDAIWGRYHKNVILDHCSMSWSTDECCSPYANEYFTMQWCILSESLRVSVHNKGTHGYGGIWGGVNASYHHNLLAHHDSRNPRFDGADVYGTSDNPLTNDQRTVDYRNCVVYNFSNYPAYGGELQKVNFIGNYYKWGPASINGPDANTEGKKREFFYSIGGVKEGVDYGCPSVYADNTNYLYTVEGENSSVNTDNWLGFVEAKESELGSTTLTKLSAPVAIYAAQNEPARVTTHSAADAFERVLSYAGASLKRDVVDQRAVYDTRNGVATIQKASNGSLNGYIDSQTDAGGWPTYYAGAANADTDGDGIPDEWEDVMGLNKNNSNDANEYTLDQTRRYTNLEVYLHWLVQDAVNAQSEGGTYTTL